MKGFDTVSMNRLVTDWAQPAFDAIRAGGMEMDYMPSHIAQTEFPETPEALAGYGLPVLESRITQRVIYPGTAASGTTVMDTEPAGDAAAEVHALAMELKQKLV